MKTYKATKTKNGYAVQKFSKVLCFSFWQKVFSGSIESVNNYINSLNNAFITYDF